MISIIVPNFNSGNRLVKNLPKLLELLEKSKIEHEIIIVDDASTDDSVRKIENLINENSLKNEKWKMKILTKSANTGFGTTVDRGIRAAKGEIVFVLNAIDILPESSDYFKIMLDHFKNPKIFSVGALKRDVEDHGCGEIYFEKGFFLHRKGSFKVGGGPSTPLRTSLRSAWADGGSQAIRKEYYLKIDGFDSLYKFYWEDVDLGYRAWKAGYQVDFEPKAILLHQKVEGPIAKFYTEKQRLTMNFRNQFIFTWKNSDLRHLLLYFLWEPYHFAVALKNQNWSFFAAYWQAFLKWPEILRARWRQKKVTKLPDDQILLFSPSKNP